FPEPIDEPRRPFNLLTPTAAVAALALILVGSWAITRNFMPSERPAMAEAVAGSLYRLSGGEIRAIQSGEAIKRGAVIRSDGNNGAVLALKDGSRIEMRSESELVLESANDGVRIRLNT